MGRYRELLIKMLEEVDLDIREAILEKDQDGFDGIDNLHDPHLTILHWQELRDRKKLPTDYWSEIHRIFHE